MSIGLATAEEPGESLGGDLLYGDLEGLGDLDLRMRCPGGGGVGDLCLLSRPNLGGGGGGSAGPGPKFLEKACPGNWPC